MNIGISSCQFQTLKFLDGNMQLQGGYANQGHRSGVHGSTWTVAPSPPPERRHNLCSPNQQAEKKSRLIHILYTNAAALSCYCFTRKKIYLMKWQWCKGNPFLFQINNTSLSSEGRNNQSTCSTFTWSAWLQKEVITAALLLCAWLIVVSIQHARQHTWCNQPNKHQSHLLSRETNSNYHFCYVSLVHPFVLAQSHGYGKQFNLYVGDEEMFADGENILIPISPHHRAELGSSCFSLCCFVEQMKPDL